MDTPQTHQFKVIGTRPVRHDGLEKVIGRAKYGADYSFPGMLYGKVLRSPHAHARIKSINAEKALRLPGVKAVVTHADFAPQTTAPLPSDDDKAIAAIDDSLFASGGTAEIKNWIPVSGAMREAGLKMKVIDYVPCYRSPAGTGNAMAFAYWRA